MTRILFFQFGDFADAFHRFERGEAETYRDQRTSVAKVVSLSERYAVDVVVCGHREHQEQLLPNLRCWVSPESRFWQRQAVRDLMQSIPEPDLFVCRTPNRVMLDWAASRQIRTLGMFADTFEPVSPRVHLANWRLASVLKRLPYPAIANHGRPAAESLQFLGIPPEKRIAWDFNPLSPQKPPAGKMAANTPFRLFYAGALLESKGVGDIIQAVAELRKSGVDVQANLAGKGENERFQRLIDELQVSDAVRLLGLIPLTEIVPQMRAHDATVVGTHHCYAEGLPNTIFEALSAATPLIVSDHPVFTKVLKPNHDALFFPEKNVASLASAVRSLISDPSLYRTLMEAGEKTLATLYNGVTFDNLLDSFLEDPAGSNGWPARFALKPVP